MARWSGKGVLYVDLTDAMTRLSKAFSYLSEDIRTKAFYLALKCGVVARHQQFEFQRLVTHWRSSFRLPI